MAPTTHDIQEVLKQHLNVITLKKSALENNFRALQQAHPEAGIAPVLKSNAYGHGLDLIAPLFDALHPTFLAVNNFQEARTLSDLGVKSSILVLGYTHPSTLAKSASPFHITIFDTEMAQSLNRHQAQTSIHLFVDTGMTREGIPLVSLRQMITELKKMKHLNIVGLSSHFADADNPSSQSFTTKQLTRYKEARKILEDEGVSPQYTHISASSGAHRLHDPSFTLIRVGLASYGVNPLAPQDDAHNQLPLEPVLSLFSILAQIKTIQVGEKIGYSGTFTAKRSMKVGLLPLGYYEGIDRRLSNCGCVLLQGQACPILGRVSMNMTVIDISHVANARIGDVVTVYSNTANDPNSIENAARTAQTIPYELLAHLAGTVKRIVV